MSAIAFTARGLRTLVDGTIRLTIDIEPEYAIEAMQAFGRPGVAGAIARLTDEAAKKHCREEFIGGPLSRQAAGMCKTPSLQRIAEREGYGHVPETAAAMYLRDYCGIGSRAELDHNPDAAERLEQLKGRMLER